MSDSHETLMLKQ